MTNVPESCSRGVGKSFSLFIWPRRRGHKFEHRNKEGKIQNSSSLYLEGLKLQYAASPCGPLSIVSYDTPWVKTGPTWGGGGGVCLVKSWNNCNKEGRIHFVGKMTQVSDPGQSWPFCFDGESCFAKSLLQMKEKPHHLPC